MKFVKTENYHPQIGDKVKGKSGKKVITGTVLEHPKHPGKPWVFSTPFGCVLCYIRSDNGNLWAINEIEIVDNQKSEIVFSDRI